MTVKNFTNISNSLHRAAKVVAQRSMSTVMNELRLDIGVSVGGTWQRRGFTSLNGVLVVMSIDSGKIVDIEPMSRYCRECAIHTRRLQDKPEELANWKLHHKEHCKLTHDGSAPSMELEGAKRIFGRSIDKHNARYTGFYGDGDSKAYTEVKDIYGKDSVTKFECIGHYQKRVGTRLRKLKKRVKGLRALNDGMIDKKRVKGLRALNDGMIDKKRVKGLRALNDGMIDKLQNYFGIALREMLLLLKLCLMQYWPVSFI